MPKRVLIVDDEARIRLLIEMLLEDFEEDGVEILTAADGQEGLDLIRVKRPGLVLLDVMMPVINGFDVCRTVKQEWGMDDVTIVLLTAKGQRLDIQRGDEAGADHYVTKPFNPDELLALVSEELEL
ncbi:MAG: response regulator [Candidatus Promineifilaceae bacterium]|nr:response regulator [Candidatus Promineifilaceae bacterium]